MNIKEERKPWKMKIEFNGITPFIFGGGTEGRNKDLKMFTIGLTGGLWFAAALIAADICSGSDMVLFSS